MLNLTYPGIYTQEVSSGVHSITGAPTSVALFVGPTLTGPDGVDVRLFNFGDYQRTFGGLSATSNLSYSVLHFFANGGGEAYVIRVPAANAKAATLPLKNDGAATEGIRLTALSSGAASSQIFADIDRFGLTDTTKFNLTVIDQVTGSVERFTGLSTSASDSRFAPAVISDAGSGSSLIKLDVPTLNGAAPQPNGTIYNINAAGLTAPPVNKDVILQVEVDLVKAADGSPDTTNSISPSMTVTLATANALATAYPVTPLQLATTLAKAINTAIRADTSVGGAAAKMEGVSIEAAPFENGTLLRVRVAAPGSATVNRVYEGTVTLTDPAALTASQVGFVATYITPASGTSVPVISNPSRYALGAKYAAAGQALTTAVAGADGDPTGQPSDADFMAAVQALGTRDPFFNILCLPDVVRPKADDPNATQHANAMSIYAEAAQVCADKFAFLLIDPLPGINSITAAENWKSTGFTFQSNHSGVYFPNVRVDDPLVPGAIKSHPPSGAIAGVFARTDSQYGVWEAPAGTEAVLSGVYGPSVAMSDDDQGVLNPIGVNCIREFPIFHTVSFGARTVDGADAMASEWKYVPVRRMGSYLLRTLSEALRWTIMKPNGEQLWSQIRMNVTGFMQNLFERGAFKGVSPNDAYFVVCDASSTTATDIDNGIVNIVIGFAPLKPAEFVVITLRQIVQPAT